MIGHRWFFGALAGLGLWVFAGICGGSEARANPRPLPFTYQSETAPEGTAEVEQFVDFIPTRGLDSQSGEATRLLATQFQTEFEYGLTDRLEVAFYLTMVPHPGATFDANSLPVLPSGNGAAQRVRYRFADPQAWPVDVAIYGEIAENEREIELEAKVILQRRIGRLRLITNLWAERELYYNGQREWVLNPTLGATVELTPRYHVGLEGWMRTEFLDGGGSRAFNQGPHAFAGPAWLLNFGRLWWSAGVYARLTDAGRATEPGDAFGRVWIRTIVGISL